MMTPAYVFAQYIQLVGAKVNKSQMKQTWIVYLGFFDIKPAQRGFKLRINSAVFGVAAVCVPMLALEI